MCINQLKARFVDNNADNSSLHFGPVREDGSLRLGTYTTWLLMNLCMCYVIYVIYVKAESVHLEIT